MSMWHGAVDSKKNDGVSERVSERVRQWRLRRVLGCVLLVPLLLYSLVYSLTAAHEGSYVWQSTTLADFLYTDLRTSCDYTPATAPLTHSPTRPLKIGIIVLYGPGAMGEWGEHVMRQVMDNRVHYATRHGYDVINSNTHIDPSRPVAWSKLRAVRAALALKKYDYVMYIDMDAVIMEPDITVESLIYASECGSGSGSGADIIMQQDWNGPNTGIWLAKDTAWTAQFLDLAWSQKQLVPRKSSAGVSHPFEYEQRAFHYLLDTDKWRERPLPTYDRVKSKEYLSHFCFLPQCAMNSYTLHPLDFRHSQDRKKSQVSSRVVAWIMSRRALVMCACVCVCVCVL